MDDDDRKDLQLWFGLDRASFCVMPRVFMQAMPDDIINYRHPSPEFISSFLKPTLENNQIV